MLGARSKMLSEKVLSFFCAFKMKEGIGESKAGGGSENSKITCSLEG